MKHPFFEVFVWEALFSPYRGFDPGKGVEFPRFSHFYPFSGPSWAVSGGKEGSKMHAFRPSKPPLENVQCAPSPLCASAFFCDAVWALEKNQEVHDNVNLPP